VTMVLFISLGRNPFVTSEGISNTDEGLMEVVSLIVEVALCLDDHLHSLHDCGVGLGCCGLLLTILHVL